MRILYEFNNFMDFVVYHEDFTYLNSLDCIRVKFPENLFTSRCMILIISWRYHHNCPTDFITYYPPLVYVCSITDVLPQKPQNKTQNISQAVYE